MDEVANNEANQQFASEEDKEAANNEANQQIASEDKEVANVAIDANNEKCKSNKRVGTLSIDAIKFEYAHSIKRSERLDNKIYITLAVYAFLAVLLSNSFVACKDHNMFAGAYYVILAIVVILFLFVLINLILLLNPSEMSHYNCNYLPKDDILQTDDAFVCTKYIESINYNNEKLNKKNQDFRTCPKLTVWVVIGVIVLNLMSKFFL